MPVTYSELPNSTFLDYDSYRSTASLPADGTPATDLSFNVALVLDRANDPTALLDSNWASRQQQLQTLNDSGTLWSTYGADPTRYDQVLSELASLGIQTVDQYDSDNGYVSSAASRTIWVHVDQTSFQTLFGSSAQILSGTDQSGEQVYYWQGNLSLPDSLLGAGGVKGVLFDTGYFATHLLPNPGGGTAVTLPQGPQSLGNSSTNADSPYPVGQAEAYNFPFTGALWDPSSGSAVPTGTIGLIEPGIGNALPSDTPHDFQTLLDRYRQRAGIDTSGTLVNVDPGGQSYDSDDGGERSMDVGIVTGVNPQSPVVLYTGSGYRAGADSDTTTSFQQAYFDDVNDPEVLSSSWGFNADMPAPGSPFLWAEQQVFIDGALRNISTVVANGDAGSSFQFGNGKTNSETSDTSAYALTVGGTSLATVAAAEADPTLTALVAQAMAGDRATIWQLVAGGLDSLPGTASPSDWLVETVWNQYTLNGSAFVPDYDYLDNDSGSGGVDPSQPIPSYQQDFGLTPTTADSDALTGRGVPDVSATAGGDGWYATPGAAMQEDDLEGGGTSASAPFWATLLSQVDAVFHDQGLPSLGYMNDLLYTAAVIAPASFNDVALGNNVSSFTLGGTIDDGGKQITPTGLGYTAGPGYDLTTGLGTPDGTILARTLTEIAHQQMSFPDVPDVLESDGSGGWQSGADQSLLFQTSSNVSVNVSLSTGSDTTSYASSASSTFAWTSQFAEQTLQADFDPDLVTMFDGQSQGTVVQKTVADGDGVDVSIGSTAAGTPQANLSTPFGFADFTAGNGVVRVAQSVAVAETAGGQDDQDAVIRIRQNGFANLSLEFYRVDDYECTVAGLAPGSVGYAAAADAHAYQVEGGGASISGPGYGQYAQTEITGVDAGDLVAMKLTNNATQMTYWAFGQANPDGAAHMWNYGANVWGWEDMYGGGDHDYNDLVVQIDFTSAAGHGWLA
jgi:hypothetical protein